MQVTGSEGQITCISLREMRQPVTELGFPNLVAGKLRVHKGCEVARQR